jgi:hypothetical protein
MRSCYLIKLVYASTLLIGIFLSTLLYNELKQRMRKNSEGWAMELYVSQTQCEFSLQYQGLLFVMNVGRVVP